MLNGNAVTNKRYAEEKRQQIPKNVNAFRVWMVPKSVKIILALQLSIGNGFKAFSF